MSNIKLVLADLDGTVVPNMANEVSVANLRAIRRAEAAGIKVCAVTGRPYAMAQPLLLAMGLKDPCVFDGGAVVANPLDGTVLWERLMSVKEANQALNVLRRYARTIDLGSGDDDQYEMFHNSVKLDIHHIWAAVPTEDAERVEAELNAIPGLVAHLNEHPRGDRTIRGLQVTHIEADKEHGVRALLEHLGVDRQHTLAIGDGNNDLPLFKHANIKVAVGNANPKLQAAADEVVAPMAEDGFAEAIERFVL